MKTHTNIELRQYHPDLIIDAMLGAEIRLTDLSEEDEMDALCKMIRWASNTKTRILSLDFPTGCDAEQGNRRGLETQDSFYML